MASNQFIARKGIISLDDAQVTGSLSVTGNISASIFSGSFVGDGSQLSGIEGFPFTGSAGITGSLTVVGPVNATTFTGDGSQLTGIEGFPFTGSARITGSLTVVGPVNATSFTGSLQGTATSASYIQLANIDGFTAYSSSVNTAIDSVLDATTPLTATVNTGSSPFTLTSQSIVVADSTDGNLTINLPDLNAIVGTPNQKPIIVYKNDYSQNVIYVQPSGSQLVNGASQDIIVSIQLAVIYNPTSAGWVTEGTSAQSLAELELFFLPLTQTGSLATTGSNTFIGNQTVTGSLTVTGGINATITGSATSASYVEYTDVANKPTLVSGSEQVSFNGITDKPALVSSSAQIVEYGIFATTGSNQFNGSQAITGSLTVTGQVVAQTLNVQQVTSSIVYSSGSNIFGNDLGNTQQFTGSLQVSGSSHYLLGSVGIGTVTPEGKLTIQGTAAELPNSGTTANSLIQLKSNLNTELNIGLNTVSGDYGSYIQATDNNLAVPYGLYLQPNGGNVGIGTITPNATLSLYADGTPYMNFRNSTNISSTFGFVIEATGNNSELWNYANGFMRFGTNNTERMRITSGGNILINQTSALTGVSTSVEMSGVGAVTPTSQASYNVYSWHGTNANWRGYLQFHKSRGTTIGSYTSVVNGDDLGTLRWLGADGTGYVIGAEINGMVDGTPGTNDMPTRLEFLTTADGASSPTERMRITSGGFLKASNTGAYASSTEPYHELRANTVDNWVTVITNTSSSPYGLNINYSSTPNSTANQFMYFTDGTALRFEVRSNGGIANLQANNVNLSDERTKKDIAPLESYWDKFKAIEIVKFKYKDQTHDDYNIGVIAQQVESVAPEFVDIDGWDTKPKLDEEGNTIVSEEEPLKSIYTADLHHATIKVLQECMSKIEDQQSQIESLKAEIQTLKQ
jgi:hypothetical protein